LYKGLKFDLRIYVLLASSDPLRIFLYRDGLVRIATEEYEAADNANKTDIFKHLTNFAINKDNPNYVIGDDADLDFESRRSHKRSILNFFEELKNTGIDTDAIWSSIKDVVIKTICSIQPILRHNSNSI